MIVNAAGNDAPNALKGPSENSNDFFNQLSICGKTGQMTAELFQLLFLHPLFLLRLS